MSAQPKVRLSEARLIDMEKERVADELRKLKADFLARQEARSCSPA